ncbi:MAG TPA: hypothetical protein PLD25_19935 [Chloroflexota bacterium]|nr:hypothetical protein [Chloroflexota bacterium]
MSFVYTYDYDSDYQPAIPTAEIKIGPAMVDASLTLTALLDSGADATMIPAAIYNSFVPGLAARRICGAQPAGASWSIFTRFRCSWGLSNMRTWKLWAAAIRMRSSLAGMY